MARPKGSKRSQRAVDMSPDEPVEFLAQFPPDELEEHHIVHRIEEDCRAVQKWVLHEHRIVHFAIMLEVLRWDEWHMVLRVDTCHSESHVHRFRRDKETESRNTLAPIRTIEDVESEFDRACDWVLDHWDEEVRRWNL